MDERKPLLAKIVCLMVALFIIGLVTLNFLPDALAGIPDRVAQLNKSDVVIVLGTPSESDGCASPVMRERVLTGVDLLKKKFASHIIFTGAAAHNNFVEADVMSDLAKANGVAPDQIVCEREARNTAQNVFNSVEIMRKHGWKSAIVVTSVAHARRACHILSHYRINYCISTCQEPADQPVYKRFVFDQREKLLLLGDLLTKQSISFGLTTKQESKLKQMQGTPETN